MPLILTLKQGEGFTVGDKTVIVDKILSETQFILRVAGGEVVAVDDMKMTKIAPGVRVMSGTRGQNTLARVCIEAPLDMKIHRRQGYSNAHSERRHQYGRAGPL